ncbi:MULTISPECIES: hypothetical protein [unclassified Bradyrhizobium]|uniref:hypothetical protein n=1 Tax=unclassified Bradyrhizobium TaxID=2631580 RepID=UPI0028E44494|nr:MULTISPECIES: hypothetical protein [unclassified Bradyrhizobium]
MGIDEVGSIKDVARHERLRREQEAYDYQQEQIALAARQREYEREEAARESYSQEVDRKGLGPLGNAYRAIIGLGAFVGFAAGIVIAISDGFNFVGIFISGFIVALIVGGALALAGAMLLRFWWVVLLGGLIALFSAMRH